MRKAGANLKSIFGMRYMSKLRAEFEIDISDAVHDEGRSRI
jgi:hypothetical protein